MSCIAILTGGLLAELQVALAAAGIVMSIADAKNAVGGIVQANKQKEASTTMHEAKKAAKVMAESIAKLTLDVINVICTVAGYFKGKKKIVNKETNQALLKKSSVSEEDLIKYLESIDNYNAKNKGTVTNYAFPFVEDSRQYHVYEVQFDSIFECINSIKDEKLRIALLSEYKTIAFSNEKFIFSSSKIAPAFNQQGGGIQYEFGFTIKTLLKIGYLKEK